MPLDFSNSSKYDSSVFLVFNSTPVSILFPMYALEKLAEVTNNRPSPEIILTSVMPSIFSFIFCDP